MFRFAAVERAVSIRMPWPVKIAWFVGGSAGDHDYVGKNLESVDLLGGLVSSETTIKAKVEHKKMVATGMVWNCCPPMVMSTE